MSKRYELIQDIFSPYGNSKKGTIGIIEEDGSIWFDGLSFDETFCKVQFQWFKEISEQENKEFVWTDELVNDYARGILMKDIRYSSIEEYKQFKATKSSNKQEELYSKNEIARWLSGHLKDEPYKFSELKHHTFRPPPQPTEDHNQKIFSWNESTIIELLYWADKHFYGTIPSDKKKIIGQFKEYKSADQPTTESSKPNKDYKVELSKSKEDKSKEWEIVRFYDGCANGYIRPSCLTDVKDKSMEAAVIKHGFTIHSVKRLSDQTIFSIGDEVETVWNVILPIQEIELREGRMFVTCYIDKKHGDVVNSPITEIQKSKPQPKERIEEQRDKFFAKYDEHDLEKAFNSGRNYEDSTFQDYLNSINK